MRTAAARVFSRVTAAAFVLMTAEHAWAQRVRLTMHPHAGDTLHVTMEHTVTIAGAGGNRASTESTSRYRVDTRHIVEFTDTRASTVLIVVDSAASDGSGPAPGLLGGIDTALKGMRVRVEIATDGASRLLGGVARVDPELRTFFGEMPATLPNEAIAVGETWQRNLSFPAAGGADSSGVVHTTFRLDSLTDAGGLAWISMRGDIETPPGSSVTGGSFHGRLVLDRRRGWLRESSAVATVETRMPAPEGRGVRVRVRMTQRLQTAPSRK